MIPILQKIVDSIKIKLSPSFLNRNNSPSNKVRQIIDTQNHTGDIVAGDKITNNYINKIIRSKFPKELMFYVEKEIDFENPQPVAFKDNGVEINFLISKIYQKENKHYITLIFDLKDEITKNLWKSQTSEVEVIENNLEMVKTDRFELYFYISKTILNKAKVFLGVKTVPTRLVFTNNLVIGNAIKF